MSELWFPDAIRKPIPAGSNDPTIVPVGNIFHIAVSESASLFDFFNGRSGGIESHGYIRRDGTIEQYRDVLHEADANYLANSFIRDGRRYGFLSWETQGMGPGEWTPAQLDTIKRIIAWTHAAHGVPMRTAPAWDEPGNGYHILFSEWSNVRGKTCPGAERIAQYHSILEPWMNAGAPTTQEDDDMASFLDEPLNVRNPKGRAETQDVTGRELFTALTIFLDSQPGPHRDYLEKARESKAGGE